VLELDVLKHRLNDEITALQIFTAGSGRNQLEYGLRFLFGHAAPLHALGHQLLGVGLTLVRRLLGNILQDDFNTSHGGDIGDALPHHARSQHTHFAGFLGFYIRRPGCPTVDLVHLEEEGVNHVFGLGSQGQISQTPALDAHGRLKIDAHGSHCNIKDLCRGRQ